MNLEKSNTTPETHSLSQMDEKKWEKGPPETPPFPPVLERAHLRKQEAVAAESLRWQIKKKEVRQLVGGGGEDNFRLCTARNMGIKQQRFPIFAGQLPQAPGFATARGPDFL